MTNHPNLLQTVQASKSDTMHVLEATRYVDEAIKTLSDDNNAGVFQAEPQRVMFEGTLSNVRAVGSSVPIEDVARTEMRQVTVRRGAQLQPPRVVRPTSATAPPPPTSPSRVEYARVSGPGSHVSPQVSRGRLDVGWAATLGGLATLALLSVGAIGGYLARGQSAPPANVSHTVNMSPAAQVAPFNQTAGPPLHQNISISLTADGVAREVTQRTVVPDPLPIVAKTRESITEPEVSLVSEQGAKVSQVSSVLNGVSQVRARVIEVDSVSLSDMTSSEEIPTVKTEKSECPCNDG